MTDPFFGVVERFRRVAAGIAERLNGVRAEQWHWPTPCAEWDVRALANHLTQGNLSYVRLAAGGTTGQFAHLREVDALGDDPVGAYRTSARDCAAAFTGPGALDRMVDYPLGQIPGDRAMAIRVLDGTVHTWDLAAALGIDPVLDPELVAWCLEHLEAAYAGMPETPVATETTNRYFAVPPGDPATAHGQQRLLRLTGRDPDWTAPAR